MIMAPTHNRTAKPKPPEPLNAQLPEASRRGSSSEAIGRRRGGRGTSTWGEHVLQADHRYRLVSFGSFPLTVTVTTMGYRSYKNPLNKAPLRTVTGRGNDPKYRA